MGARTKLMLWILWMGATLAMTAYFIDRLRGTDRRTFLPGATTHGHHQIEMDCNACHTPMMGVKEDACIRCHGTELKAFNDSHPKSKFTDPRNADRLSLIKADNCVTCHREHQPEITQAMGVTQPSDYCVHCHVQTLTDRPSHKDFTFNSCATAGCHNYHDNTALYESFLLKHAHGPDFGTNALRPARNLLAYLRSTKPKSIKPALSVAQADAPTTVKAEPKVLHDWESTAHAKAGVNCNDCHLVAPKDGEPKQWLDKPGHQACAVCHKDETSGFLAGFHGMRLAQGLSPMTPSMAQIPMKAAAAHRELSCASCHGSHDFDTRKAAVESCLSCHADAHSLAYQDSSHFRLWQDEIAGKAPTGSGVSCATCHLPREVHRDGDDVRVLVQHNQNANLRPNEKMIRSVCLDCHGLGFSLDALADAALVRTNFNGRSAAHIESIDLALKRQLENQKQPTRKTTP
jgi:formate-dependent nitrite reductase cytochrome c552 subunit